MRNVKKYIDDYEKKIGTRPYRERRGADVYREELMQLIDLSNDDQYTLMSNCLDFGFMVGYCFGIREQQKKQKERG